MNRPSRIHLAVNTTSLEVSKEFYALFFGTAPSKTADDRMDWVLNNPPIHFSMYSSTKYKYGIEHMGIDFTKAELEAFKSRVDTDGINMYDPDHLKIEVYSSDNS